MAVTRDDVKHVAALRVVGPSRTVGGGYQLDLQLVDSTGAAITFRNFTLNIGIVLRARSLRVDGQTAYYVEAVRTVEGFLGELRTQLKDRSFTPVPVRERMIPKPGGKKKRRLGIATVVSYCTSCRCVCRFAWLQMG